MKKVLLTILTLFLCTFPHVKSAAGGIPVIDGANLQQNAVSALEAIEHTANQIAQLENMITRYENMVKNTIAPATYLWSKAHHTIATLQQAYAKVKGYTETLANLDDYLSKFKDVNYYSNSPCFKKGGCSEEEKKAISDVALIAAQSEKEASDAMLRNVKMQMEQLEKDAKELEKLQQEAEGDDGHMKALVRANEFAAKLNHQTILLRSMLGTIMYSMAVEQEGRAQEKMIEEKEIKRLNGEPIQEGEEKSYSPALF